MKFAFGKKKKEPPVILDERLRHIAFIMDGNGRWAKKRGLPREEGHRVGAKAFQNVAIYCEKLGLQVMTVYAFSTENWKRPPKEVNAIMDLMEAYLDSNEERLKDHPMQFHFLGDRVPLRQSLQEKMKRTEERTAANQGMILNIALNYGARSEICHAASRLCLSEENGPITEERFSAELYTAHCPDPDMVIRTGGDYRISNFLLWQSAYAELYFTDTLWPDFDEREVDAAIRDFYSRKRRFGGI